MKKLLAVKSKVFAGLGLVSAVVVGNVSMAAADTAIVKSIVDEFIILKDTAKELATQLGPVGVGIVVALFIVILSITSSKKVGNVAVR